MAENIVQTEKDTVRVTVHVGDATIDLSLPYRVQVSSLAPMAAEAAVDKLKERGLNTDWLEQPTSEILLAPPVGRAWAPTSSLSDNGILDGDYILLTVEDANETYPELIEVMQDATVQERNARFREWDLDTSYNFASYAFPLLVSVIALAAGAGVYLHADTSAFRWVLTVVIGVLGVLSLSLSYSSRSWPTRDDSVGESLALASYVPLTVAAATLVPGDLSRWSVLAGAAAATAVALVFITTDRSPLPAHYSALVPGLSTLIGVTIGIGIDLWRDVPTSVVAAIVATIAILVFHNEPTLSRMGARLELPYLPSQTAEGQDLATANIVEVSRALSDDSSWDSMVNQRERNIAARYNGMGIIIGVMLTLTSASVVAAMTVTERQVQYLLPQFDARSVMLFHFLAISVIFALQGSWYRDRVLRAVAMIGGTTSWAAYTFTLATGIGHPDDSAGRLSVALAVFLGLTLIACAMAWRARPTRSARTRKWFERFEALFYLFPIINIVVLLNLVYLIRHS